MTAMRRAAQTEHSYTVAEFEQLPQFSGGWELIDGQLERKLVPGGEHALICANVRDDFRDYNRSQPKSLGFMLQETSVKLGPHTSPIPDLSFWKAQRGVKVIKGAMPLPDLAVEVHSPSDLKSGTTLKAAMVKVENLLDAGVPIVWVVYPNRQEVEIYHAARGFQAGPVQVIGIGGELDGEDVIPGYRLPVSKLFESQ